MNKDSRSYKVVLNARVNLIYYLVFLLISFFSRKLFLDKLGTDFIGLSSAVDNLLSMLNLAELGIGSSIAMTMYKPIYDKDKEKLNDIISVLGFLYSRVGTIVLICGVILSAFIPLIFAHTIFEYSVIYCMFFSMLSGSLIGYFVNYSQFLFNADQKSYEVTRYSQGMMVVKVLLQMGFAYYFQNYYLWIAIEFIFGILFAVVLRLRVKAVYPWLKPSIAHGKEVYSNYKVIMTKAKQVFVHGLAANIRYQLLPFLVYSFTSLHLVALYTNYTIILNNVNKLIGSVMGSTDASVGNLVAEGDKAKIMNVFWEIFAIKFIVAVFTSYIMFVLINPFIRLWLGSDYIISDVNIILILLINYLSLSFSCLSQFRFAYGLVHDVWAPIATIIIMVPVAIVGGHYLGLTGVLLGNVSGSIIILAIWHPYFLFTQGFNMSVREYWKIYIKYIALSCIAIFASCLIIPYLPFSGCSNYFEFLIYALEVSAIFLVILLPLLFSFSKATRSIVVRIQNYLSLRK